MTMAALVRGRSRWTAFAAVATFGALIAVGSGFSILSQAGGQRFALAIDDGSQTFASFVATVACAWAAMRNSGRLRRGWTLMAVSSASYCIGQAIWTDYEAVLRIPVPFPSAPYLGFVLAIPLAIASILSFWTNTSGNAARWRVWIDGLIVFVALTFVAWIFGLKHVYLSSGISFLERLTGLAYPLGEILLGSVLVLAIRRSRGSRRGPMTLLLAGAALKTMSDLAFIVQNSGGPVNRIIDVGWVAAYMFIALSTLWPAGAEDERLDRPPVDLWQLALPWTAVLAAAGSGVYLAATDQAPDRLLTLLSASLGALLMLSQVLNNRDFLAMLLRSTRSEALLSEMVAHARRGIARTDATMRIVGANPGLGTLLGEDHEALIGTNVSRFLLPETRPVVAAKFEALAAGRLDTVDMQLPAVRADGSALWLGATAYAIKDRAGRFDYALTYLEDLTASHEAEKLAESNLAVLERLNKVKTEFMQSISHEFKTALVGIQGYGEFIRDSDELDPTETKACAGDIVVSAERMSRLVTEMTDLNSAEMSAAHLSIRPVDLRTILTRELEGFVGGLDGVTCVTELDSNLPAVAGDAEKLAQVVRTLLSNALRYSPDGGRIRLLSRRAQNEVEVVVADQGVGRRSDLDNPVLRSDDIYSANPIRKVVGTGLGLGIVHHIVEIHGGRMWSVHLEEGTEIHFTVPVAPAGTAHGSELVALPRGLVA